MTSTVLPTPAPPNMAALPPLRERRQQVDHLDAGLEEFALGALIGKPWWWPVDRPAWHRRIERRAMVTGFTQDIDQPAEHRLADRHGYRRAGPVNSRATPEAGGAPQRHGAHRVGIEMLLNFGDQTAGLVPFDLHRLVDVRQIVFGECYVHHRTAHDDDPPPLLGARLPRHRRAVGLQNT